MERPHAPTPRRRALARRAGWVLTSPALTAAVAWCAGVFGVTLAMAIAASAVIDRARHTLAHAADDDAAARAARGAARLPFDVLIVALPVLLTAALGALAIHAVIARGLYLPRRREVRGAPAAGADATTAGERATDAALAAVRTVALVAVATWAVTSRLPALATLAPHAAGRALWALAIGAAAQVGVAAIALALLEVAWRQRRLARHLAMTPREWRDDLRDSHGDPRLRQARRAARADDRHLVATARVVIVDRDLAIAIGWRPGDAPHALRVERGLGARRLIAAARASAVPLVADAALATEVATGVTARSLPRLAAVIATAR